MEGTYIRERVKQKREGLFRIARFGVSLALLLLLFYKVNLFDFLALLRGASPWLLLLGLLLVVAAVVVSSWKWQALLTVQGVSVNLWRLFCSYLVGLFFNNFLPTNIGGDVVRVYDVAKYSNKPAESAASVIAERLLASFALALTAASGLLLSYQVSKDFAVMVGIFFVVSLGVIGLFASKRPWQMMGRWLKLRDPFALRSKVRHLIQSMSVCLSNKFVVGWVILLSLLFHALVVLINYVVFAALGMQVSLVYCLLFIPIISAISMLPISVNGLGVREGAYVYFFQWVGLTATQAIAASLLFFALVTLVSLFGGLIFALRK